ncbi:Glutathione S-transferase Mu 4 [Halotydeus destructor]|nr:Glutathione S-transferase Mu 4 [Halotydeus destructor]
MAPILGYWNIRAYAQPIRLLLAHVGVEFEDKKYNMRPNFSKSEFHDEKHTLGLDFPNLPYYIDGEVRLSQSIAILRHIARQHGLDGATNDEKTRIDLVEQQLLDYRQAATVCFYYPNHDELAGPYREALPGKLEALSNFLGGRKWLAGDNLSYVDFLAYEWLDVHQLFEANCLDAFPSLLKYKRQFEALPNVEKYMKSDKFMKWPLNNDQAKWGHRGQPYPGK